MPHLWGNILVVTVDELVPKYYKTYDALKKAIQRYSKLPYGIKKVQSGGNGRRLLINFETLPKAMQDSIGDPRKMKHPLLHYWEVNSLATAYYTTFEFEDGTPLKQNFIDEYITNASVLIALKNLRDYRLSLRGGKKAGVMKTLWEDLITFNDILPKIHLQGHTMNVSERHFVRLFKAFLNGDENHFNFSSLISKKLRNNHARVMTEEMIELLNAMFAGQDYKPTRTEVANKYFGFLEGNVEVVNHSTGEVYEHTDRRKYREISENSIIAWLGKWEHRIGTHAKRSGNRQELLSQYIPYHSLEKVKEAGVLISIDDRQPPFFYDKGKRMWFYMGIDLGSEAWVTWVYGESKEGLILEFYRQMVRNYTEWGLNLPLELECESALNANYRNTFLMNGAMFDRVRIEANKARAKHIERYFGKLRYEFEKEKEGWLGRPFARKEDNQKGAGADIILPKETIIRNSLYDIQRWNNMEHSRYKGKTRWEVFTEMQSKDTKPTNWRAILPHLGRETVTSCNAGIVKFRSSEYLLGLGGEICTGEDLIRLMKYVEGRSFKVYWLDGNDGGVLKAMICHDDMMLCELIPKPTYSRAYHEMDDAGRVNRQIMSAYENTVTGFMCERKNDIDRLSVIDRRSKMLNHKFVIPGLEDYIPASEPANIIEIETEEQKDPIPAQNGRRSKSLFSNFN
ncbi:hypothetical protein [Riemerella columbipharyngis]|uniref:Uncharacterized protein n=1 Tax=Riemerella columbipharyngis TaxID=1071918 RepID=A0A1G7A347_9FLAO|nr:hypothetical protein [Riemerella columbipharyngis]SDE08475.1 hypothetical protein SAMN05421544_1035 [Riemerella columbipharyngis]